MVCRFLNELTNLYSDISIDQLMLVGDGHCFRDQALSFCELNIGKHENMSATSLETIIYLVAAGQGVTLIPALALQGAWN